MSHNTALVAPTATVQARLRASFKADIGPTLLWGGLTILALIFVPPLISWAVYQSGLSDGIVVLTTAPASTVGAGFIVLAIVGNAEDGTGRRGSVVAGWTRKERIRLTFVFAAGFAVIGAVLWFVLALFQPVFESWLVGAFAQTGATIGIQTTAASPTAAFLVAIAIFTAAFVPLMYVRMAHIHWTAVVAASIPLGVLTFVLGPTYLMFAEPSVEIFAGLEAHETGWWLLASVLLSAAYVVWVWRLARTATIHRYGE